MTLARFTRLPFATGDASAPLIQDAATLDAAWAPTARYRADPEWITLTSDRVSQWSDMSGNDKHLIQATAGSRPIVSADAINGLDVVTFGDTDTARFLSASAVLTTGDSALYSMAVIYRLDGSSSPVAATYQALVGNTAVSASNHILWANKSGLVQAGVGGPVRTGRGGVANDEWHLAVYSWDDATEVASLQVDRSPVATATGAGTMGSTGIFVGASTSGPAAPLFGDIAEIVIFPVDVFAGAQADQLASIKAYTRARYALDV